MKTGLALTTLILKNEKKRTDFTVDHRPSIIVSVFTIIFSLSIVLEIREMLANEIMFYVLTVFVGIFLIFNEFFKNEELRKFFSATKKANLSILLITFTLSVGLSLIGTYLWVNKSYDTELASNDRKTVVSENLANELYKQLSNIKESNQLINNSEYKQEYANIQLQKAELKRVWKQEERAEILHKIGVMEDRVREIAQKINRENEAKEAELRSLYKAKIESEKSKNQVLSQKSTRNAFISYILCFLTLLNDFVAIMFAKKTSERENRKEDFINSEEALRYVKMRHFLKIILMKKKVGSKLCIWDIKNSNPSWDWIKDTSFFFSILQITGITSVVAKSEAIVEVDSETALIIFDTYFNELF